MAANFHDALTEAYANVDGLPPIWFGVAPEGAIKSPPYAVLSRIRETPNYGSSGLVEYMQATTIVVVYGLTADQARAGAQAIRDALGPDVLAIDGKKSRLYQGEYEEDKTGDRGPQGEYLFCGTIPLMAEIS